MHTVYSVDADPSYLAELGRIYALAGKRDSALAVLAVIEHPFGGSRASEVFIAKVHAALTKKIGTVFPGWDVRWQTQIDGFWDVRVVALPGEVPDEEYVIPLGVADIKREGTDISLIAHGRAVITCLKAAEILAEEHGIDCEVVDLRSIRPLDEEAILKSVRKTSKAIYVEENKPFCGVGAQIASLIGEKCFDDLDAPVLRISAIDAPAIYSMPLEKIQLPYPQQIVDKVLEIC